MRWSVISVVCMMSSLARLASCDNVLSPPTNGHSMSGAGQGLVVNTASGLVQGSQHVLADTRTQVRTWLGLPYARPPTGPLRFMLPQPVLAWSGIRDSVLLPPACPQTDKFSVTSSNQTSEDCLYLNIYSAETGDQDDSLKPVIVWIHPGEFNHGSASSVDPSRLAATGNVIVVTIQYRLGALGYMYLGDDGDTGQLTNLGLRDQLLALDWISENILHFGGDPTRVTLAGAEAGAVSASYHVANIHVSHVIHSAILQSGGPHNNWAKLDKKVAFQRSSTLTKNLGCNLGDIECLQNVDVEEILAAQNSVCEHSITNINCFVPVLDGEIVTANSAPANNNTNIMFGFNSNEGFLKLMQFLTKQFPTEKLYSEGFSQEIFTKMLASMFPEVDEKSIAMMEFLYEDVTAPTEASLRFMKLERIVSDYLSTCSGPELESSYRYMFSWQPSQDKWPRWSGVKQGDEIQFVMGEPLARPQDYLIEEKEFSKAVMKLWSQFARSGTPDIVTGLVTAPLSANNTVFNLNPVNSGLQTLTSSQLQKCSFWKNVYPKLVEDVNEDKDCQPRKEKTEEAKKAAEIETNEIPDSHRRVSSLYVDQPELPSAREERGLYRDSYTNPHQFVYKVRDRKHPGSTSAYLEKSYNRQKVFKRQLKPENNTQLSYQLSVGFNSGNSQPAQPFAVYNTHNLGNSPIYIAPNKYQAQDPIFNDDNLDSYHGSNVGVRDSQKQRPTTTVRTTQRPSFHHSSNTKTQSYDAGNMGYDPFFPSFGARIKSPAAVVRHPVAAVSLPLSDPVSHDQPRSYFPN